MAESTTLAHQHLVQRWLHQHARIGYLTVFCLITLPAIPLYFAASLGRPEWIWPLIGLVMAGNLLAVFIP